MVSARPIGGAGNQLRHKIQTFVQHAAFVRMGSEPTLICPQLKQRLGQDLTERQEHLKNTMFENHAT